MLFLILIAVALFAALSYAVTQSTRGGGNADEETQMIDVARYTQVVSLIRTEIQRMRLVNGTAVEDIELCDSGAFCTPSGAPADFCTSGTNCLFAPDGGGVDPGIIYFDGLLVESGTYTIDGHGTQNLILQVLEGQDCVPYNRAYGLSTTTEEEQTALNNIYADGIPSLSGQWDFCYEGLAGFTGNRRNVHLLATN